MHDGRADIAAAKANDAIGSLGHLAAPVRETADRALRVSPDAEACACTEKHHAFVRALADSLPRSAEKHALHSLLEAHLLRAIAAAPDTIDLQVRQAALVALILAQHQHNLGLAFDLTSEQVKSTMRSILRAPCNE